MNLTYFHGRVQLVHQTADTFGCGNCFGSVTGYSVLMSAATVPMSAATVLISAATVLISAATVPISAATHPRTDTPFAPVF